MKSVELIFWIVEKLAYSRFVSLLVRVSYLKSGDALHIITSHTIMLPNPH